ncbi:MAG TPA: hypothetical protein P5060_02155 [Candidatus Absconditabacterales bacterium]|nr:hypothetical protein [Candidatus Absconditabacterales bacterium]
MVNENIGAIDGIDTGEGIRQDVGKVTEKDVKRAQTDSKKAQQAQDEIKKDKQKNNQMAEFLSFLLKSIKNDKILDNVYQTFFKVTNPKNNMTYIRKSINNVIIVGFFVPFFQTETEKYGLKKYFEQILQFDGGRISFEKYMSYIKQLSQKYHDNIPINQQRLIGLLALISQEFGLQKELDLKKIEKDIKKRLK